jgi:hypothetical protein
MIETAGTITVAEAARRLKKSTEQVRRDLREGKLMGQRIGNQWFVDERSIAAKTCSTEPLISRETLARIDQLRKEIIECNGGVSFDVIEMIRRHRDET